MKKQVLALAITAILLAACGKKEEPAPAAAPAAIAATQMQQEMEQVQAEPFLAR